MFVMSGSTFVQTIDRRALNHMAPDVRLVHMRLEAWAHWAKDSTPGDWPKRTILGRLIDEGPGASHGTATVSDIPEAIAETDRAVAHLPPEDRKVIREFYLSWAPRELIARRLRLTPRRFDAILNRARWRICGFLCAS